MVFGLFEKGKMEIQLEKLSFSFGDTIKGKVTMKLNKPIKARGMNVSLYAIEKTSNMGTSMSLGSGISFRAGSRTAPRTQEVRIFDFKLPFDSEKEYGTQPYEYNFEIKIPMMNQRAATPQGIVGDAVRIMSLLSSRSSVVSWWLDANLDIAMGFDVSKKVQLNIG